MIPPALFRLIIGRLTTALFYVGAVSTQHTYDSGSNRLRLRSLRHHPNRDDWHCFILPGTSKRHKTISSNLFTTFVDYYSIMNHLQTPVEADHNISIDSLFDNSFPDDIASAIDNFDTRLLKKSLKICEAIINDLSEQLAKKDSRCEAIVNEIKEELAKKDDKIASLEENLVRMALENASLKAFEDEHRANKRIPRRITVDNCEAAIHPAALTHLKNLRSASMDQLRVLGKSCGSEDECATTTTTTSSATYPDDSSRKHTTTSTTPSLDGSSSSRRAWWGRSEEQSPEASFPSVISVGLDDSSSSRLPSSFRHLFRSKSARLAEKLDTSGKREYASSFGSSVLSSVIKEELHESANSLNDSKNSLGVVFPRTFNDVVSKGLKVRRSLAPLRENTV